MNNILKLKIKEISAESANVEEVEKILNAEKGVLEFKISSDQNMAQILYVADVISDKRIIKLLEEKGIEIEEIFGTGGYS